MNDEEKVMSDSARPKDDLELATINRMSPPGNAVRRLRAGHVALLVALGAALALLARQLEAPLDVYRTIDDLQFADASLRECVVATAREQDWANVGMFTSLRCNSPEGNGIRNLAGIEHLVELTDINFAFNQIGDVAPLAELSSLAVVDLSHNQISELPVFRAAHALRRIDLNYNRLTNLSWLTVQHFPQLNTLAIAHNDLSDLGGLELIPSLRELSVRGNHIVDLQAIRSMQNLELLDAGENQLADISGISDMLQLRQLFLDGNRISKVDALRNLLRLEELSLENNTLGSVAPLAGLERLQRLNLERTGIGSLGEILTLGNIEELRVGANEALDCSSIFAAKAEYGDAALHYDQECANEPSGN